MLPSLGKIENGNGWKTAGGGGNQLRKGKGCLPLNLSVEDQISIFNVGQAFLTLV